MEKMWAGRFKKQLSEVADRFNSSIGIDRAMYRQDIEGSAAHASMLSAKGIISKEDGEAILAGLEGILSDIESEALEIDPACEDIHMFVEKVLTERIGDAGKKLHTARSRNDQVALDLRLYLRDKTKNIISLLKDLIEVIVKKAEENTDTVMPGYTHLQRAQPITFAHHILAYSMMFKRDILRLKNALSLMDECPLGSCALAGTTYDTDRQMTASTLGFSAVMQNSIDGVSDRDYCVELQSAFSLIMMHLSRFSEEIILWSSLEFAFVELDDSFTTGSSIMPQKKNSDMAELVRGKSGRVFGNLFATLTMLKGLPLAYNKDMQEDKEAIFDSVETVEMCLTVFEPMIDTMTVKKERMYEAATTGFINATDLADYLVKKGMPFRTAYKTVGELVAFCIENSTVLDKIPLEKYKEISPLFDGDLYGEIDLTACVKKRISEGSTGPDSVRSQISAMKTFLKEH